MPIDRAQRLATGLPLFIESIDEDMPGDAGMPRHDIPFGGSSALPDAIAIEQEGTAGYAKG
jgi:hypothetical protein